MSPTQTIRFNTTQIQHAYNDIEHALTQIGTADDWRSVLGYVEEANRRGYQLRKTMLDEAIRGNKVTHV